MKKIIYLIACLIIYNTFIIAQDLAGGEFIINFVDRPEEWEVTISINAVGTHWNCDHHLTSDYSGDVLEYSQNSARIGHYSDACWDYQGYDPPLALGKYFIRIVQPDPDEEVWFYIDWRTSDLPPVPTKWDDQSFQYSISENKIYRTSDPNHVSVAGQTLNIWDELEYIELVTTNLEPYAPENLYWYNFSNYPRLQWSPSSNTEDFVTHYEIHRYTSQGWELIDTKPAILLYYVDWEVDLSAPEQYEYLYYKVRAKNGNQTSDEFSNTVIIFSPGTFKKDSDGINPEDKKRFEYKLEQNHPNPFNPTTLISFSSKDESNVTLTVFDILGNKVTTLIDERLAAGEHRVEFDGSQLKSGIYFYEIRANDFRDVKKLLLLK